MAVDKWAYRQYIDGMPRSRVPAAAAVVAIQQLGNSVTRSLGTVLAPHGITPQQWSLLTVVRDSDEAPSLATIARAMMVTKQNITGMAARMEQLGVIRRSGDPGDLRASRIELTRRGEQMLERIDPLLSRWSEELFGNLAPAQRKQFERTIATLLAATAGPPEPLR